MVQMKLTGVLSALWCVLCVLPCLWWSLYVRAMRKSAERCHTRPSSRSAGPRMIPRRSASRSPPLLSSVLRGWSVSTGSPPSAAAPPIRRHAVKTSARIRSCRARSRGSLCSMCARRTDRCQRAFFRSLALHRTPPLTHTHTHTHTAEAEALGTPPTLVQTPKSTTESLHITSEFISPKHNKTCSSDD